MPVPEEAGFALEAGYASHMDAHLLLADEYAFWDLELTLHHFAASRLGAGFPACGPVWPRLDPNSLRFAGRARSATAVQRTDIRPTAIELTCRGRKGAGLSLTGVAGSGFYPTSAQFGVPGQATLLLAALPAAFGARPAIHVAALERQRGRAEFPSAGLDLVCVRPEFKNRRAERRATAAPEMPTGIYLPVRRAAEALRAPMPSPGYLGAATLAAKSRPAAPRAGRLALFGQPAIQIPESPFRAAGASMAALEQMVSDLVFWSPRPIGLPRRLIATPTPVRSPRCTIVRGPELRRALDMPEAAPVTGLAAAGKNAAARRRQAKEEAFLCAVSLPGAAEEESGVPASWTWTAPPALALRESPACTLPAPLMASAVQLAAMFHGEALETPAVIEMPGARRRRPAGASDPEEASYLQLPPPAVSKGVRPRRAAPGEIALPVETLGPALPELPQRLGSRRTPEAELSAALAPIVARPPRAKIVRLSEAETPRFAVETSLPAVEGSVQRGIEVGGFFALPPSALKGRRGAPALSEAAAGSRFFEPLLAAPAGAVDQTGVWLAEAPCTTLGPQRPRQAPVRLMADGPVSGEIPPSLPEGGVLPGVTLAEAQSWLRRPNAFTGAPPRSVEDQTPAVPAPAPPEMTGLVLGVTERSGAPISDLLYPGPPKTFTMTAVRRALPEEPIAGPGVSLPDSPDAEYGHSMPDLGVIAQEVRVKERERKAAGGPREDMPVPGTLLPELAAEEKERILISGAPAWQPCNPLRRAFAAAGPGGVAMTLAVELPPRGLALRAVQLAGAGTSTLAVRSAAWKFITQTADWTAFPESAASMPRPSAAVLGVQSLIKARLEKVSQPGAMTPRQAWPQHNEEGFPQADVLQPSVPVSFEFSGLIVMPAMRVPPVTHRGAAVSPWRTEASIIGPGIGLPVFAAGILARLLLMGLGFEAARPAKAADAQVFRSARRVVVPIPVGDGVRSPEARLAPPTRLKVMSADIEPRKAFPNAWNLRSGTRDAGGVTFLAARPVNAESKAIAARRKLGASGPAKVSGRPALGRFPVSPAERMELHPQPAALPGAQRFALSTSLMTGRTGRVPPRPAPGGRERQRVGWQTMIEQASAVHYLLISSRKPGVIWPNAKTGRFQDEPPAKAFPWKTAAAGATGTQFPLPEALRPKSKDFRVGLSGARLSRIVTPKWREDRKTAERTVWLAPAFQPVRRPEPLPSFRLPERRAAMPWGVFTPIEAHDDFEDYGTMTMAPRYEARILDPAIPGVRRAATYGGDVSYERSLPFPPPSPHGGRTPIGASVLEMTTRRVEMPPAVDAIPEEFDPALVEAARRKGIEPLVGAFKSASKFFKFTVLVTLALGVSLQDGGLSGLQVQGFGDGFAGIGSEVYRSGSRIPGGAGFCRVVCDRSGPDQNSLSYGLPS